MIGKGRTAEVHERDPRVFSNPRGSTVSIDVGFDFKEEDDEAHREEQAEKWKEVEQEQDFQLQNGRKRRILIFLFGVFLIIPAVVLLIRGLVDAQECGVELSECELKCRTMYADDSRIFQSQFAGERGCIANCESKDQVCLRKTSAIIAIAVILSAGLFCAICLLYTLDAIMNRFGGDDVSQASKLPRAAYLEPMYTEDEIRKQPAPFYQRWLKRKKKRVKTVEVKCVDCDVDVDVDVRWMTGEIGGSVGARCPRCRKIIVGVA